MTTIALFKMLLDNSSDIRKKKSTARVVFNIIKTLIIIALATLAISYVFLRFTFIGFKINSHLFAVMLLITLTISIFIGILNITNKLFKSKENALLFSMPCNTSEIFWAKIFLLFLFELKSTITLLLPVFISFGFLSNASVWFYVVSVFSILLLSVICFVVSALLSIPTLKVQMFLSARKKLSLTLTIFFILGALTAYLMLVFSISDSINFTGQQYQLVVDVYEAILNISTYTYIFNFLAKMFMLTSGAWWMFIVTVAFTAMFLYLAIVIIKKYFFDVATYVSDSPKTVKKQENYTFKKHSHFAAMFKNEAFSILRSRPQLIKFSIFTAFMPVAVLIYDRLLMSLEVNSKGDLLVVGSHIMVISIFALLSNFSAASSVSKEGNCAYLSKVSPISFKTYVFSKLSVNYIFTAIAVVVTSILCELFTPINMLHNMLSIFAVLIVMAGHLLISFLFDLRKPYIKWMDEAEIDVKSKSQLFSMLIALVVAVCMFLSFILFSNSIISVAGFVALFVFCILFTGVCVAIFCAKAKVYFKRLGE